ncbi:hypothetical protein D5F11_020870 [Siminovitchia terrae]|uniref:Uncharacterized protein n=1 Tax=Siminovitchia terrae TaxID=1914933 RepID=A0A429X366_SIMTE|nr:hypothetical protein [Siminovitchia terrae]RST57815.1 hypothetical protein D5F11_020870 [Siminovitchia terrae]
MGSLIFSLIFLPLSLLGLLAINLWLYGIDGIKKEFISIRRTETQFTLTIPNTIEYGIPYLYIIGKN